MSKGNETDRGKVVRIRGLLRRGHWSQSEIASRCGVSATTVSRINLRMLAEPKAEPVEPVTLTVDDDYEETKPYRCKGCGEKVTLVPCMMCWALATRKVG